MQIIQIIGIIIMLSLCLKFKRLWLIYLSTLLMTNFYGFVDESFFVFKGLNFKLQYIVIILALGIIYNVIFFNIKNYKYFHFRKIRFYLLAFFLIQVISFFLTFFKGYNVFYSLIFFIIFASFILLDPLIKVFISAGDKEVRRLYKTIINLTLLNGIIFILARLNVIQFYDIGASLIGEHNDVARSIKGYPFFIFLVFPQIMFEFIRNPSVKNILSILTILLVVLFTYTRSIFIATLIGAIIIYFLSIQKQKTKYILSLLISIFILILIFSFFNKNTNAFKARFTEKVDVATVDYRYESAKERFEKTILDNPFFGLGFIYHNEAYKLGLKYRSETLIHPDIFWPNLLSTTGIFGSLFFILFLYYIGKLFYKTRYLSTATIFLVYLIMTLLITFASGGVLFDRAAMFTFTVAIGFALIQFDNQKLILKNNNCTIV